MVKNLGELFRLIRNGVSIKQYEGASGFPITRIQTISNGVVDRSKVGYADIDDATIYSSYILQDGDILMSHINSLDHLGKAALYQHIEGETLIHGMNLLMLRADTSSINPKYAFRLFQSNQFKLNIQKIAKKSVNQASFSVSDLKRLQLIVPSLDSQTYVASLFDTIDCIITKTQKLTDLLDCLVKSRFIEMFGDPIDAVSNYRLGDLADMKAGSATTSNDIVSSPGPNLYPCFGGNGLRGYSKSPTHDGIYPLIGRQGALCGNVQRLC